MSGSEATEEMQRWVDQFASKQGRPLRVLHYGNIANNAYLNAKALRTLGVEADVLSHDYYHIMGCPEWEDAELSGSWGDDFNPDWSCVQGGFERPPWFYSGRLTTCIADMMPDEPSANHHVARKRKPFPLSLGRLAALLHSFARRPAVTSYLARHPGVHEQLRRVLRVGRRVRNRLRRKNNRLMLERLPPVCHAAVRKFDASFSHRKGQLRAEELVPMVQLSASLKPVFQKYDVIHAYGQNPISLWLSGVRPYVAYEHGTIRQMPFEESTLAATLALAYLEADDTIITNCDNKVAAERIGIPNYRFVPHPVNEDFLGPDVMSQNLRESLVDEFDTSFIVLHPSRQHWSEARDPSLEKGNDVLIRGFARLVHETDPRALLVMMDWGQTVEQTRALLEQLGCSHRVKWIRPQPHRQFARWINASDVVADQFYLGAFGSLTPKAMACGKPVLLKLDEQLHSWCFNETPAVVNVGSPDGVFQALALLSQNPTERKRIGDLGKSWYEREHSMAVVTSELLRSYRDALSKKQRNGWDAGRSS